MGNAGARSSGYTAADDPDMRKNPDLYSNIQDLSGVALSNGSPKLQPARSAPAAATAAAPAAEGTAAPAKALQRPLVKPEVLAPAGGWPQLKAAVENGADAVYFGALRYCAPWKQSIRLTSLKWRRALIVDPPADGR